MLILPSDRPARLHFRPDKTAEAIDLIARECPNLTQYFVGKFLYLADKAHFLDWGRPITFDRYFAMEHGPVPSAVRNMLAAAAGAENGMGSDALMAASDHAEMLAKRVRVELAAGPSGERQRVSSRDPSAPFEYLSGSDIDALSAVINEHRKASFGKLREKTHLDDAWAEAWAGRPSGARRAEIDLALWAPPPEREGMREHLREIAAV